MAKFFKKLGGVCVPFYPAIITILAVMALLIWIAPKARAQNVCTYTEQTGAVRNCTGTSQLNQVRSFNNGSGAITAANTSQTVFAANPARQFLYVANPANATEPLYVNYGTPALAANSIALQPGGVVQFVAGVTPVTTITASAATAGHPFVAIEGN